MPASTTPRFALPLLSTAQAHKEITHNEALQLADAILCLAVMSLPGNTPPVSPLPGQCWIIGASPTGAWTGFAKHIAVFGEGGWRFIAPVAGMAAWIMSENLYARYMNLGWSTPAMIALPTGGAVIDSEARNAIAAIVQQLQAHGLSDS